MDPTYPTPEHARAAESVVQFFQSRLEVDAVLLVGSCARGLATVDSCLDIAVLVGPQWTGRERLALDRAWERHYEEENAFRTLEQVGAFSQVDLEFIDGMFVPRRRDWTSGPDGFELEIGNCVVYGRPLFAKADSFERLQRQWLPYYEEELRQARLAEVLRFCRNNLAHVPGYVERGEYFQAFRRLYDALREFLQALFIARRTYPIAYDKWIREQIVDLLGLPALYPRVVEILEVPQLEGDTVAQRARQLEELIREYVETDAPAAE